MERFRFGEQEGPNGKKLTRNGWLAVWGGEGLELDTGRCSLEVAGPKGAVRAVVVMDKATAGKLGAALMQWAGLLTYELTPESKTEGRAFSKTAKNLDVDPTLSDLRR